MNSPVIQIFYIVAGVIFALIIDAASKYVVPNINRKPMNGVHIIYCILTPLVIWQFIFQFTKSLGKSDDISIGFIDGIFLLIVFFLMAIVSKIVYPSDVGEYSIENQRYNKHIKENKHLFFILLASYLLVLTIVYQRLFGKLQSSDYVRLRMSGGIFLIGLIFLILKRKNTDFMSKIIEPIKDEKKKLILHKVVKIINLPNWSILRSIISRIRLNTSSNVPVAFLLLLDGVKVSILQWGNTIPRKFEKEKASVLDWIVVLLLIWCFIYFAEISIDTK